MKTELVTNRFEVVNCAKPAVAGLRVNRVSNVTAPTAAVSTTRANGALENQRAN
jgi:hypothetical protein